MKENNLDGFKALHTAHLILHRDRTPEIAAQIVHNALGTIKEIANPTIMMAVAIDYYANGVPAFVMIFHNGEFPEDEED